jgi:hypothetical protein
MTSWKGARWGTVAFVLLSRRAGVACGRDESFSREWSIPVAEARVAAPLIAAPTDTAQVDAMAALVGTPALEFVRHDLDSSPYGQDGACTGACVPHEFCSRSSDYATAIDRPKLVVTYVP